MRFGYLLLAMLAGGAACHALSIEQYHTHDFAFTARVSGNPFDAELRAEFQGPSGLRLSVPGFYDGDGVWKIRFSPTVPGPWSFRTESGVPELNGRTQSDIQCEPNRTANIHGGLLVDPLHPAHFIYQDGSRYFLMGYEADWLWAVGLDD